MNNRKPWAVRENEANFNESLSIQIPVPTTPAAETFDVTTLDSEKLALKSDSNTVPRYCS
jgi:hypothetical protein